MSETPSNSAGAAQAPLRVTAWTLLAAVLFLTPTAGGQEAAVSVRYYGHSFFLVTAAGLRIAIDPFGEIGYPMPDVEGDVVLITHEHRDHNNAGLIRGARHVLRGLAAGGLRLAHMGDIGHHPLSEGLLRTLGSVDVLMIPVGGGPFTIGGREAAVVTDQVRPRIVIPMHYRTAVRPEWPGTDERPFLEGKPSIRQLGGHTLMVARDRLPAATQVVVMSYR